MSFWKGLAGGLQQVEARRERQTAAQDRRDERTEARDYRDERDAIADNRYDTALASTQAAQAIADQRNTELWDRGTEDRDYELHERSIDSALRMRGLFGANATSGSSGSSNPASSPTVPRTANEMRDAMINFGSWVGGEEATAEMTPEHQEFYNTMGSDPQASAGMMDFIESQSAKGNIVTVQNLPDLINLAGVVEGKGVEEYEALQNTLRRGTFNFEDTEAVVEGIRVMQGYSPETAVYAQTGVALPAQEPAKQFDSFVKMLPNEIYAEIDAATESGDTDRVDSLNQVRSLLESDSDAVKNRGMRQAFALGVGVDLVDKMGIADNPYLPARPQAEEPVVAGAAGSLNVMSYEQMGAMSTEDKASMIGTTIYTPDGKEWVVDNPYPDTGVAGQDPDPLATDAEQELIDAANNPDMEQDERDAVFERAAAEHPDGWKGVRDVLSRLDSDPMAPIEEVTGEAKPTPQTMQRSPHPEVDTSEQDSKDLVMMMEDPNIDQEMLNEAINAFQQKYGPGSAAAAFDMIMNKSQ